MVVAKDPAHFVLTDVLGDGGVGTSGEEDGAADGKGAEEFGGDDGAGPIFVEADEVDVGGSEGGVEAVGGGEGNEADVGVVGAEGGFAVAADAEGCLNIAVAGGAGEGN